MNRNKVIEAIKKYKLIVIMRGIPEEKLLPVTGALREGGIMLAEVTFDQRGDGRAEYEAIRLLNENFGGSMIFGAGTVLNGAQLALAANAGAQYIISPDTNETVIKKTRELGLVSIPGAMTPTEICAAYSAGADYVKLFPADALGTDYIKSVRAPLPHIPMLAVGGVDEQTIMQYLGAGMSGLGVGGNILKKEYIENGNYNAIRETAKRYVDIIG